MAESKINSSMDLLWENPNPTQTFAEQSILNISLENYKFFIASTCDYALVNNRADKYTWSICMPEVISYFVTGGSSDNKATYSVRRIKFDVINNRIDFSDACNEAGVNNGNAVPIKIYGIK